MVSLDRPFSAFAKEHRPLSAALARLVEPLDSVLRELRSVEEIDRFVAEQLSACLAFRPELPELGGLRPARVDDSVFVQLPNGRRVVVARHMIALEIRGDVGLFTCWPSESEDLQPVDASGWPETGLTVPNADPVWDLGIVSSDAHPNQWALYTYVDLTLEEEQEVAAARIDLVGIVSERVDRIEPILERIRQQIAEYFDVTLPQQVTSMLAKRREMFANREGVTASLVFPRSWELPEPQLEAAAPKEAKAAGVVPVSPELSVEHTPRLSPVSFARLQRTIRVWADAVERYPQAFSPLTEDRVSDLLAATLNATLPGANREVYSRHGKSDIFVSADVLAEGSGPANVFITETKWVRSQNQVREALDPQLFGYLNASDTAAVLLLLLRQADRRRTVALYSQALRDVPGFQREDEPSVNGWPVLVYRHEHRLVRVCVAWVHIPADGQ